MDSTALARPQDHRDLVAHEVVLPESDPARKLHEADVRERLDPLGHPLVLRSVSDECARSEVR